MWLRRKTANIYVQTEHFTLCVKYKDTTTTANIKIVVLQSWHIFTRIRTIDMFWAYLNVKLSEYVDNEAVAATSVNNFKNHLQRIRKKKKSFYTDT